MPRKGLSIALLVVVLIAAVRWFLGQSENTSTWEPTHVSYQSECEEGCLEALEPLADIQTPHLSGVRILIRADVDDAISQLGDCIDSIMACVAEMGGAVHAAECVARSQCPKPCKEAYRKKYDGELSEEGQLEGVYATFLADDAPCLPREGVP